MLQANLKEEQVQHLKRLKQICFPKPHDIGEISNVPNVKSRAADKENQIK